MHSGGRQLRRAHNRTRLTRTRQANSSFASMEGYTLEGTKKTGASVKRRTEVLAAARKSSQPAAEPEKKKK